MDARVVGALSASLHQRPLLLCGKGPRRPREGVVFDAMSVREGGDCRRGVDVAAVVFLPDVDEALLEPCLYVVALVAADFNGAGQDDGEEEALAAFAPLGVQRGADAAHEVVHHLKLLRIGGAPVGGADEDAQVTREVQVDAVHVVFVEDGLDELQLAFAAFGVGVIDGGPPGIARIVEVVDAEEEIAVFILPFAEEEVGLVGAVVAVVGVVEAEGEEELHAVGVAEVKEPLEIVVATVGEEAGDVAAVGVGRIGAQEVGALQRQREVPLSRRDGTVHRRVAAPRQIGRAARKEVLARHFQVLREVEDVATIVVEDDVARTFAGCGT